MLDLEEEFLDTLNLGVHSFLVCALAKVLRALLEDGLCAVLVLLDTLAALHALVFKVFYLVEHALGATPSRTCVVTLVNIKVSETGLSCC